MKKKSFVGVILFVLFAVLMAGGIFVYLNFRVIAKDITEQLASEALGVKVKIYDLEISLKDKEVTVRGVSIFNPPGYQYAHLATVGKIKIGLKSISKDLIDFNHITVEGLDVNLEVTSKGNNLKEFKEIIAVREKREKIKNEHARVIIRKMSIGESVLNPRVILFGDSLGKITIPPVFLTNIGLRENGIVAKDAVTQIAGKYIVFAERKASGAGLLRGAADVKKVIDNTSDGIKKIGNDLTESLGKSLGGIFGK